MPEYETTDEDEEGDEENSYAEQNNPFEKTDNDVNAQDNAPNERLISPAPHDRLNQYMNGSTALKDNQKQDGPIHISTNDLGLPNKKQGGQQQANTSSKKQQQMNQKNYQ